MLYRACYEDNIFDPIIILFMFKNLAKDGFKDLH